MDGITEEDKSGTNNQVCDSLEQVADILNQSEMRVVNHIDR